MSRKPRSPEPEQRRTGPRPYRQPRPRAERHYVMTVLRPDAWEAVRKLMQSQNLSASGAVHHLVRLGAGLPSLLP